MWVCQLNPRHLYSCRNCFIKNEDDVEFLLAHIRKMQINTVEVKILAINKMSLSTKTIIDREKSDVNVKILWIL